jgi:hypothetical protein
LHGKITYHKNSKFLGKNGGTKRGTKLVLFPFVPLPPNSCQENGRTTPAPESAMLVTQQRRKENSKSTEPRTRDRAAIVDEALRGLEDGPWRDWLRALLIFGDKASGSDREERTAEIAPHRRRCRKPR